MFRESQEKQDNIEVSWYNSFISKLFAVVAYKKYELRQQDRN